MKQNSRGSLPKINWSLAANFTSVLFFLSLFLANNKKNKCSKFCSETDKSSLTIYTKIERCHSSHLKQTTEDVMSIWLHSWLYNKVSIALYLNTHNKTWDSETTAMKRIWKCPQSLYYKQNLSVYSCFA